MKTETCKLYTRDFEYFCQKVIKIDLYNSELYRFEVGAFLRHSVQCESKKSPPPYGFPNFFPKRLWIFNQFLHTYYVIISTLDYKFLFNYLQLWQSYAILSATT